MVEELFDAAAIHRTADRMALEIVEEAFASRANAPRPLALIGIRRGGVPVSALLAERIERATKHPVPVGTVDIALYRDDAATALPDPKIGPSSISFPVDGVDVVLVDDVLQTGRTIRAAIDCLLDYGRPRRVWLAVLFDRGGRELPIAPDFVGRSVELPASARLEVRLDESGALAGATVTRPETAP